MVYMDRPLLIINFQGVLGDFIKLPAHRLKENLQIGKSKTSRGLQPSVTLPEEKFAEQELMQTWRGLNLRQGVLEGLRYLSTQYQLVVFSRETIEESWFEQRGG